MRPILRLALLTFLLLTGAASCYSVEHPTEYACSPAESRCPEGFVCDGTTCVAICASWSAWAPSCELLKNSLHCRDRTLTCDNLIPPYDCSCTIGSGSPTPCGAPSSELFLCNAAKDVFTKGCCKP